jgi:hypothetical protein
MQVEEADALAFQAVTSTPGSGMVISGAQAWKTATFLKNRGYPSPLLVDRQVYKGKGRRPASAPFDPNWINRQRELELPLVVPDAGYVAAGDLTGLQSLVRRARDIEDGLILLPLANYWLYGAGLRMLLTELKDVTAPLAMVLEHQSDPMKVRRIFEGMLAVLRTGIEVVPMRCDVSALGLLAHGALAAAFGSRSSLRHLYPVTNGGGGGRPNREAALWPAGLALHHTDVLNDVISASPDDGSWRCLCEVCDGKRIDRLHAASNEEIRRHNAAALLDVRTQIMTLHKGEDRQRGWGRLCTDAARLHLEIGAGKVAFSAPQALSNWAGLHRAPNRRRTST